MSRQYHLPPRCPTLERSISDSPNLCKDTESFARHRKSKSQSFFLEQKPPWIDDLLSDPDAFHRRAAGDSVFRLDGLDKLPCLKTFNNDEDSVSSETCSGLGSLDCMYGPNSPRRNEKLTFPENDILSALSEYASRNPMDYTDGPLFISGNVEFDSVPDARVSAGEINAELKPVQRHSGQRSRVRKLQYIAELQRTVEAFQTMASELAARVSSLLQQRVAFSMVNRNLKQQLARLDQEKLIIDGQYQSMRKEIERLKLFLADPRSGKVSTNLRSTSAIEAINSEATRQILNLGKLDLN